MIGHGCLHPDVDIYRKEDVRTMRILIADDEQSLVRAYKAILERSGYEVDTAADGMEVMSLLGTGDYDLLLLDSMMPRLDGIGVLRKMRASGNDLPVLMLTAKSETEDKVEGLDAGANDYLTKPFKTPELLARIRALLRPAASARAGHSALSVGGVSFDDETGELRTDRGRLFLSNGEHALMAALMRADGGGVSVTRLAEILGHQSDADSVSAYVSFVSKKLSALSADASIVPMVGADGANRYAIIAMESEASDMEAGR